MQSPGELPAIRSVRVGTTGTGSMHREHRYGSPLPTLLWVLLSRRWVDGVPVHFFAIDHRDGLVLFDTGLDPACASNPREYLGSALGVFFLNRLFRWQIRPEDNVTDQLALMGHDAGAVRKVVFSHLHFDHTGCIDHLLHAELIAPRREWQALTRPKAERSWYLRQHVDLPGAQWTLFDMAPCDDPDLASFDGCLDVMGDGSIMILPTPGHTAGSVSMLLRSAGMPPILLIADLAFELDMLMADHMPGVGEDFDAMRDSYARVRALRERLPGLIVLPSHDMETAARLSEALPA
ncbi:metallo-beta-lactamase superfamily protein [Roseinatronobacter monicus]|uniref:Metallo-beta-lactamase superfamily protein n=2 Tax=Roseinatronobacter monicus TaxID=393481 RepID=A0A543K4S9_9RHOB|nr:metallo-beta-lactamase superfamily protein [Roseinatronobacter monicus]